VYRGFCLAEALGSFGYQSSDVALTVRNNLFLTAPSGSVGLGS
jgi:hypothetical protein